MLVQFSVENYMSIKEKVIFSMLASSDKELSENLINGKNEKYLKSAVIYGANASGKTNLLKAINSIIFMMRNSNNMQPGMKLPIIPFKFDDEFVNKPSSFEFIMIINDITEYYILNNIYERANKNIRYDFETDALEIKVRSI